MKIRAVLVQAIIVAFIVAVAPPSYAHHSVASGYFLDRMTSVEGSVVEIKLRNPHSSISLQSKDADGRITLWTMEWIPVSELGKAGVNASTLKAGDVVTITGSPSRASEAHQLLLTAIARPADGWKWDGRIVQNAGPTIVAAK